jgi:hypothetical protein
VGEHKETVISSWGEGRPKPREGQAKRRGKSKGEIETRKITVGGKQMRGKLGVRKQGTAK